MDDVIRFEGVRRSFGRQVVLDGLSFRVPRGEVYALLGRNGAGKTTALSILMGFLRPMAGRSSVLGEDSLELSSQARLKVGLVTEGCPMYKWMSVKRAVAFEAGTRPNFDRDYAWETLERLKIPARKSIRRLSRGMRAQLALVFAMAGDPELLVLDDPALGLDAVMRREFLEAMIELLGREGRSVLFSSHMMADVERVADRVGILHEGRMIVDARHDALRERVQRRFARCSVDARGLVGEIPGLLRAKPVRDGYELLCLDMEGEREDVLRESFRDLSEPQGVTLEQLFVELTADDAARGLELRGIGGAA